MWKQIKDFDKDNYKDEFMVLLVCLGMGYPVFVTGKYSKDTDSYTPFFQVMYSNSSFHYVDYEPCMDIPDYHDVDIRCWCYADELAVDTGEFKGEEDE